MLKRVVTLALFLVSTISFSADFIAGQDYEIMPGSTSAPKAQARAEVIEFFSFGCPWCYRLEPLLNEWLTHHTHDVDFKKIPVVFNHDWQYYAKAYYVANALSLNSKINPALFKAVLDDKKALNSDNAMIHFFVEQGVDEKTATAAFEYAPSIDITLKNNQLLMMRYHVNAVPALLVNQRYKTDLKMAKDEKRLLAILDFLLHKKE